MAILQNSKKRRRSGDERKPYLKSALKIRTLNPGTCNCTAFAGVPRFAGHCTATERADEKERERTAHRAHTTKGNLNKLMCWSVEGYFSLLGCSAAGIYSLRTIKLRKMIN